jgi:hypothetical protein
MKTFYLSIFLLLVIASSHAASAQKRTPAAPRQQPAAPQVVEYNAQAWKTYSSSEGGFTVLMPGTPGKSGELLASGSGPLAHYTHTLQTSMAEYGVTYSDFPQAMTDPAHVKSAFDGGRDALLDGMKLRLVSEHELTIDGFSGRQILAENDSLIFHDRFVAVNKRLYQVIVVFSKNKQKRPQLARFYDSIVEKYLGSFKLINTAEATMGKPPEKSSEVVALDLGRVDNSVYTNEFFGLRLTLPTGWNVVANEVNDAALDVGKEIIKGVDKTVNAAVDKSIAKTVVLVAAGKHPFNTHGADPAMIQCGAERLSSVTMTSAAYMESNKKFLLNSSLKIKLVKDTYTETIGGVTFAVFDMEVVYGTMTVKQRYHATIRKGFALFIVTSYVLDEDFVTLSNILTSVKFDSEKPAS